MTRHIILMIIGLVLLLQGLFSAKRAKTIGRVPLLTAAVTFLLEPLAGTIVSKTIYLVMAFCAIGASLLLQYLLEKKQAGKQHDSIG